MEKHPDHLPSKLAIGLGIAALVGYEAAAPDGELISEQVKRWMESPAGKLAVHFLVWTTAAHLTRVIPEKYDWLAQATRLKKKK